MSNHVSVRLEVVLVSVQDRCTVCAKRTIGLETILHQTYHRCTFWTQAMELLGDGVMWNLVSVHLETVLVSVQDRCMVCARCTIGSEIILDRPDVTAR